MKKKIAVIIPAYNESECVDELASRLAMVFDSEPAYDFEAIIVENGSTDDTMDKLLAIHEADPRFKILQLARNFRMDGGLTAGLNVVDADAVVLMTADLQDPPEFIPEMIRKWEEGYENVYGVVTERRGTGPIRTMNSQLFYWLAGKLTDDRITSNASDFRLVDRKVYEAVRSMDERNRFVRGLFSWVGFKSIGLPMERPPRFAGESKAYSFGVIDLAFKGIFAHSYVPLRLITLTGFLLECHRGHRRVRARRALRLLRGALSRLRLAHLRHADRLRGSHPAPRGRRRVPRAHLRGSQTATQLRHHQEGRYMTRSCQIR